MLTIDRVEAMKLWRIYRIYCDATPKILYIGISSRASLKLKLTQHLRDPKNHWRVMWFCHLKEQGLVPVIEEICSLYGTKQDAEKLEQFYIRLHKSTGYTLINVTIKSK